MFNVDDAFGAQLAARPQFDGRIACSSHGALVRDAAAPFVRAHSIAYHALRARASSWNPALAQRMIETPLIGAFNVDNVLAVLAVLLGSNLPLARCVDALKEISAPRGRLETFCCPGHAHWWWWILRTRRMHCRRRWVCCAGTVPAD